MDGKWEITVHTYMGDMKSIMEYKVEDGVLTGTGTDGSNGETASVDNGKFDGTNFSYSITIKTNVGVMTNTLEGVYDGETLKGQSSNAMGSFDFDGVRI